LMNINSTENTRKVKRKDEYLRIRYHKLKSRFKYVAGVCWKI